MTHPNAAERTYLVTGGAGFIGANLVRRLLRTAGVRVVVLDRLTYAGHRESLADVAASPGFTFVHGDVCDRQLVRDTLGTAGPDVIFHLAAESHVDRSIDGPGEFVRTNVVGTSEMLEATRLHLSGLSSNARNAFRFVHVSTDEVFGSIREDDVAIEASAYAPNSPYAASKAGADYQVRAYAQTFGLPTVTTHGLNTYGPYQFPEKLIPLVLLNALEGEPLPVYGDGGNVRDWLYVDDHCEALLRAAEHGRPGETYNVGAGHGRTTLQVVRAVCDVLQRVRPQAEHEYERLIRFVSDRPGHDRRYALAANKARTELGWRAQTTFAEGLEKTVRWYLNHLDWCKRVGEGYRGQRLGVITR